MVYYADTLSALLWSLLGIVLTTRPGNAGLTCYPKTAMLRCARGNCTTTGANEPPSPQPPPPPPPPPPPGPPPPAVTFELSAGRCMVAMASGNVELTDCIADDETQQFRIFPFGNSSYSTSMIVFACIPVANMPVVSQPVPAKLRILQEGVFYCSKMFSSLPNYPPPPTHTYLSTPISLTPVERQRYRGTD